MELYAKKSLGQHFLNSKHVLDQIIKAASLEKGKTVLEIGPGTGILTEGLLETGASVVAIEKDRRAIELLRTKFEAASHNGRLIVIEGDVLDENIFDGHQNSPILTPLITNGAYSIVANIPYYITGAILEKFLEHEPRPNRMILLVQKEVAKRIVSGFPEGDSRMTSCADLNKESILSISVKAFGTPKLVAMVPRGAFTPTPTVDSAILSITDISNKKFVEYGVNITQFFDIVRAGFAHKRKYLVRNLEHLGNQVDNGTGSTVTPEKIGAVWAELKMDQKIRAENVSLDQWFKIASKLNH